MGFQTLMDASCSYIITRRAGGPSTVSKYLYIAIVAAITVAQPVQEAAAQEMGPPDPRPIPGRVDDSGIDPSATSFRPGEPKRSERGEPILDVELPFSYEQATSLNASLVLAGMMIATAPTLVDYDVGLGSRISRLDPTRLNPLDRTVIGNRSKLAATGSDLLLSTTMILPHVVGFIDSLARDSKDPNRWSPLVRDGWIMLETMSATFLVTNMVKFTQRRARPYAYDSRLARKERGDTEASLSFFSGHTSIAFSMATSFSYLYTKRHRGSPLVALVWTGSHLLASSTAILRVAAGKHFWSDVLVGAAVGSGMGLAVPALHDAAGNGVFPKALANLRFLPVFHHGGFGVNAVLAF